MSNATAVGAVFGALFLVAALIACALVWVVLDGRKDRWP